MNEIIQARYAAARTDAAAAEKAYQDFLVERSRLILEPLLMKSIKDRFDALERHGDELLRSDRRKLVRSIRERQPAKIAVSANTASQYDVWRSKLPYRVFPLGIIGVTVLVTILLAAIAHQRTPQEWVSLVVSEPFPARVLWPTGEETTLTVTPGQRFPLMRVEDEFGVLRYWVQRKGYAELRLPVTYLRAIE